MVLEVEIFFCYAREDEEFRKGLEKQLRVLKRQGIITIWHDREINAGTEWEREIDKHLNSAQIILLLISPDFMDSDYCYGTEMRRAMERHERGEVVVIPIILRPVYFLGAPFGKLQALPTDQEPVTSKSWASQDDAFFDVAEGIRKVVEETMSLPFSPMPRLPAKPVSLKKEGTYDFILDIDQGTAERNAQSNLFVHPPNIPNQQGISSAPVGSASENVHIESLFSEAVIAQSNGNLEKALEQYQQVRKQDPNYRKGELASHLKKMLLQQANEAKRQNDQKSQIKFLRELLILDPNDNSVQQRLESLSKKHIEYLRKQANSARQSRNWKMEYQSWEEKLKLRSADSEALMYIKPVHIKYLRQQARKARKAAAWDDEVTKWSELLALQPSDAEAKRRLVIAENNQDNISKYENALHLKSEDRLDEARDTLERLWQETPYYGDPKRLARKVGILVPLPLEKRRKTIWLTLLASIAVLVIFIILSVILSASNTDSSLAWYIAFMIAVVVLIADIIVLFFLSDYWLLIDLDLRSN
jgi:tetratricopeptide (TPR) repeat protein